MGEIRGITFSNQAVTPKDDGRLRSHLLRDGIITGCAMAYSAATFSLSPGYLIAAGRMMQNPAMLYKAVDQATSGYARIVLTIDLTETATKEEFNQAALSVEYSSTMGGFSSLTQGDVNGNDAVYQVALAVVTLGTGGITGIVSKMPQALLRSAAPLMAVLTAAGWDYSSKTQTVSVPGVTADPMQTHAIISQSGRTATEAYNGYGIFCESQGDGFLVFSCESIPSVDLNIGIMVIG